MWEMGNRLLTKIGVKSTPQTQTCETLYPALQPIPEASNPQYHLNDRYAAYAYHDTNQHYLNDPYNQYPLQDQLRQQIAYSSLYQEPIPIDSSSTSPVVPKKIAYSSPYQEPIPIDSSVVPKKIAVRKQPVAYSSNQESIPIDSPSVPKKRAVRKPPIAKPKTTDTIFDACQDASYTRISGYQWPDPDWVPSTPYKNKMIYAKVVNVYDGDTFTVLIMYGDVPMKLKIRLQGVDAPELVVKKKPGKIYTPEELELMNLEMRAGAHVRDKVKKLLEGKEVIVKLIKCDKYGGRHVGAVYLKPQSYETLTEYLLSKRYGKPYQAQKKDDWTREELTYILNN